MWFSTRRLRRTPEITWQTSGRDTRNLVAMSFCEMPRRTICDFRSSAE